MRWVERVEKWVCYDWYTTVATDFAIEFDCLFSKMIVENILLYYCYFY